MRSLYRSGSFPNTVRLGVRSVLQRSGLLEASRPLYRRVYELISRRRTVPVSAAGLQARLAVPTLDFLEGAATMSSETDELPVFLESITPDSVLWDIGANVGLYSVFAGLMCPMANIVAFEPMPQNVRILRRNLALNLVTRVSIQSVALSNEAGRLPMYGAPMLPVWYSLFPRPGLTQAGYVEVCTGDQLVAAGTVPSPTLIKIDAEGYEFEVLAGLAGTLAQVSQCVIMVEDHDTICAERGVPLRRENALLTSLGFALTLSKPRWRKTFWEKKCAASTSRV